jgi:hypothetical protein
MQPSAFSDVQCLRPRTPLNVQRSSSKIGCRFFMYSLFGWGVPLILVIISQILDEVKNLPPIPLCLLIPKFEQGCLCPKGTEY